MTVLTFFQKLILYSITNGAWCQGVVDLVGGAILGNHELAVVKLSVIEYMNEETKIYDNRVIEIEELTVVGGIHPQQSGDKKSPAVSSFEYIIDAYRDFVKMENEKNTKVQESRKKSVKAEDTRDTTSEIDPEYDFVHVDEESKGRGKLRRMSEGEIFKKVASLGDGKVYSKSDAMTVIEEFSGKGDLTGAARDRMADKKRRLLMHTLYMKVRIIKQKRSLLKPCRCIMPTAKRPKRRPVKLLLKVYPQIPPMSIPRTKKIHLPAEK